jgi:hypothetical protein
MRSGCLRLDKRQTDPQSFKLKMYINDKPWLPGAESFNASAKQREAVEMALQLVSTPQRTSFAVGIDKHARQRFNAIGKIASVVYHRKSIDVRVSGQRWLAFEYDVLTNHHNEWPLFNVP